MEDRGQDLPRLAASIARAAARHAPGVPGKLALLAASLAFALLAAEVGVRLFAPYSPSLLVADPLVGKRFLPGFTGRVYVPECGCDVDLRFNRDGLRGPDRPLQAAPGVRRVALVGDSMVAAVATAEERTLASVLEKRLRDSRPDASWEVMNAGVSSSSTGSEDFVSGSKSGAPSMSVTAGSNSSDSSSADSTVSVSTPTGTASSCGSADSVGVSISCRVPQDSAIGRSTATSCADVKGLPRKPFMPAARHRSLSRVSTLAVKATIAVGGTPSSDSPRRISAVAVNPSIPGIWQSMRITSKR